MSAVPPKMRAILVKGGTGPAESLYIGETETPKPKEGEVLVKIKAFGLNRMDIMQREGHYPVPPHASPIMGVEFSGHVVSVHPSVHSASEDVPKYKEGDEVFGLAVGGAYAEYIACPAKMCLPKPKELSWEVAAAIPENFFTSYQALKLIGGVKEGDAVLIHAAASGVGLASIQLARTLGAKTVIGTCGTEEKAKFVESLGATAVNYKTKKFEEEVEKITNGAGVNFIQDFIGGPYFKPNMASLGRDGVLVLQGALGGMLVPTAPDTTPLDISPILFKRLRIEGTTLRSRTVEYQSNLVQGFLRDGLLDRIVHGSAGGSGFVVQIHKVYSWKEATAAHKEMEANRNTGKIVFVIDD